MRQQERQQKQAFVVSAVRGGNSLTAAARMAGVADSTVSRWRRKDRRFAHALAGAQAEAHAAAESSFASSFAAACEDARLSRVVPERTSQQSDMMPL